jgi:exopolysaccharide production protein ExoQ
MIENSSILPKPSQRERSNATPVWIIGAMIGVLMPMIAAWVYPTYTTMMPSPVVEWTRLQEIPFVVCEALIFLWALYRGMELRNMLPFVPRDYLVAGAVFMVGLWGSTLFVSKVPITSLVISITMVVHVLFAFSVYYLADKNLKVYQEKLVVALGIGLVALTVLTAFRFLFAPQLAYLPATQIEWGASLPGFINVRHFGSWTGAIAAIFTAALMARRDDAPLSRYDFFFFLSIGLTIWSGTRAAVLAIAVSVLIMVISNRRLPSIRMIGRLSILTGVAASLAFALIPYGDPSFLLFEYWDSNAAQNVVTNADQISSGRMSLWHGTYTKWLEAPWFGWGSGSTFWEVFELNWRHTQPHNFILQFLISWGIVGAAGALWLLARVTISAHNRVLANPELWPLLVGVYSLLVMAMLEGMLHYPRFIMLIMALYALIFRLSNRSATES